ncbi:MAG TPA: N-acetyl-gamma-glutamyl-phosphate reductase [Polyangiaceae bacterium]|nr:N-acetyl-gamma-glutamyl-phosphate reductase [Polyangiaceae bacterium]
MKAKVAVLGASGFAGAELLRRLLDHPALEVVRVCANDHVGELVSSAHPHLEGLTQLRFENPPHAEAARGMDAVLMGLPHGASVEVVDAVAGSNTRIVDMSGAFRVRDASSYEKYYGAKHPRPELLSEFVYGLPELNRERIRGARFVASAGCFATTIELMLLPFAKAGLLRGSVEVVGITGSSGAGATPTATTHHPVRAHNLRTYKPLEHAHTPEIIETLTDAGARELSLRFVPVSAPLTRGIFATAFFRVPASVSEDELRALPDRTYRSERCVVVPQARLPEVVAVIGSNRAEVGVAFSPVEGETRGVTVFGALDNLVKGGAGQALQNLNLMLGLDELTGLSPIGLFP